MHACVIMHNMIVENERGQDVDYSQYELLGHPVRVRRRTARVARLVASYHAIRRAEMHDDLSEGSHRGVVGMEWADKEHDDLYAEWEKIQLQIDEYESNTVV